MRHPELEAEVAAAPDDDAPRRVYADWLLERADPRGEFIVLQCELARLSGGPERRAALEWRERELLAAYGPGWLAELGFSPRSRVTAKVASTSERHAHGSVVVFRRGFADEAKLGLQQLLDASRELVAAPLRRLVLTNLLKTGPAELGAFAALAPWPSLTALCFRRMWLDRGGCSLLVGAHLFETVQELVFQKAHLREGLAFLGTSGWLGQLRKLGLNESYTQDLEALAPSLDALEVLDLEGSDASALWMLFRPDRLSSLRVLNLRSSRVGDAMIEAILSSQRPLVHLDLGGASAYTSRGLRALTRTQNLPGLEVLRLSRRNLSDERVVALQRKFGDKLVLDGA